jgi:hypothetical protein
MSQVVIPIETLAQQVRLPDAPGDMERRIEIAIMQASLAVAQTAERLGAVLVNDVDVAVLVEVKARAVRPPDGVDKEELRRHLPSSLYDVVLDLQ